MLDLLEHPTTTPVAPVIAAAAPAITLSDDERQRCEVWTRVMGYHRPVTSFNKGKQGEFGERVYFDLATCDVAGCGD